MEFQNDPNLPDYCPNPLLIQEEAFTEMGKVIHDSICEARKDAKDYTDQEVGETTTRIDALETTLDAINGSSGLTDKVAAIETLINSLDTDGDGQVIDQLNDLLSIANAAQQTADAAETKADEAKESALATREALVAFQETVNNTMADHSQKLTALQTALDNMNSVVQGLTAEEVRDIANTVVCEFAVNLKNGIDAGVAAFKAEMAKACPVDEESGETPPEGFTP